MALTYATWNPSDKTANATLSNGNLTMTNAAEGWNAARSTVSVTEGKWYWEITLTTDQDTATGTALSTAVLDNPFFFNTDGWAYNAANGNKRANGVDSAYGNATSDGDVMSIALDMDNGKLWWGINGTWQASGDPAAGTNAAFTTGIAGTRQYACDAGYPNGSNRTANFGATAFAHAVPTGFNAGLYGIQVDATSDGGQTTVANSLTWAHTCTGTNLILVVGLTNGADDTTGVTYNGVALTAGPARAPTAGNEGAELWFLENPATGANNIVASRTGTTSRLSGIAVSYTGAAQTGQPDSSNTGATASGTSLSISTTVVAENCWLVMMTDTSAGGEAAGAGTVLREAGSDASDLWDSNGAVAAGSRALAITATSGNLVGAIMSIAPAGAAAPPAVAAAVGGRDFMVIGT